jgi:hypothetical protein
MKKRFSEEQIVRILRQAEAADQTVAAVCKAQGISEQTWYRWKRQYGQMGVAAGFVGLLRITSLVHYPSDVFAGMLIGVLAGWWSVHWAMQRFSENPSEMPERWRVLLSTLVLAPVPLLSPLVGMKPLLVFLRFYGILATGLLLIAATVRRHAQRQTERVYSR